MASVTQSLLHGSINYTHTSNLTASYSPQNLPTPWPLAIVSVVLSLALSCYGIKPALLSWTQQGQDYSRNKERRFLKHFRENLATSRQRKTAGKRRADPIVCESELEDLHRPDETHRALHEAKAEDRDPPPKYSIDDEGYSKRSIVTDPFADSETTNLHFRDRSILEEPSLPKWDQFRFQKAIMVTITTYLTFRAGAAFATAVSGLITHNTPPSAPSILFLLILTLQIYSSNRSLPRLLPLILTLSTLLTALAFLISGYAPLSSPSIPNYGSLSLSGGRCPVHASDCTTQTTHWTVLGCGNYTYYIDADSDNDTPESSFYVPYQSGDLNSDGGSNPLHIVETVIRVCGTIWLPTVLFQVYEVRHLVAAPVLRNLMTPLGPGVQTGRGRCGSTIMNIIAILGVMGAFIVAIMSIAAHCSQALGNHSSMYIDSFGQGTWANFTHDKHGYVTSTGYWGNATVWNDCFTVPAPRAEDGGWAEWVGQNGGVGGGLRIAAGL